MAATPEELRQITRGMGEPWELLAHASNDAEFDVMLTGQEKNLLRQFRENPNIANSYQEPLLGIVGKYPGWKVFKDSKLKQLTKDVGALSTQVQAGKADLAELQRLAQVVGGVEALAAYAKIFKTSAKVHAESAAALRWWYFGSVLILLVVVGLVFFLNLADYNFLRSHIAQDLQYNLSLAVFGLKVVLVFFFFQLVQFFRKNYNAEKHLEETYLHRSNVLQSLHAVYRSIDDKAEKDKLLTAAALFAFERGETGYITTKEGAGGGEVTETFLARLLK
jgi:hypothetical protein